MHLGLYPSLSLPTDSAEEPNKKGERDPQMHQTRKGKQWYFGMKIHVGAGLSHVGTV